MAELCFKSYLEKLPLANTISSFKNAGIWPFDTNVFSEVDFLPSKVTDRTTQYQASPNHANGTALEYDKIRLSGTRNGISISGWSSGPSPAARPSTSNQRGQFARIIPEMTRPFPRIERIHAGSGKYCTPGRPRVLTNTQERGRNWGKIGWKRREKRSELTPVVYLKLNKLFDSLLHIGEQDNHNDQPCKWEITSLSNSS